MVSELTAVTHFMFCSGAPQPMVSSAGHDCDNLCNGSEQDARS